MNTVTVSSKKGNEDHRKYAEFKNKTEQWKNLL